MKYIASLMVCYLLIACSANEDNGIRINVDIRDDNVDATLIQKQWHHGNADCKSDDAPAIDVFRYQASSYILRQNKCQHFEAPFIYLLFGENKALLLDTGAVEDETEFPLYQKVKQLMERYAVETGNDSLELIVLHSHAHSDHYAGDSQFSGQLNISVVAPTSDALKTFLTTNRTNATAKASLELGKRKITIIATPGHQEEAITLYDEQTQWLLTGDSFYPGVVYVKHWQDYRASIKALNDFSMKNEVSGVLGSHIEMKSSSAEYYDIGSTYQPNEAPLVLSIELLQRLSSELEKHPEPVKLIFDDFIIFPMNSFQRSLSDFGRLVTQ